MSQQEKRKKFGMFYVIVGYCDNGEFRHATCLNKYYWRQLVRRWEDYHVNWDAPRVMTIDIIQHRATLKGTRRVSTTHIIV
jgi:hypothetical protein